MGFSRWGLTQYIILSYECKSELSRCIQFHSKVFLFWLFQKMWWIMTHFMLITPVGKPKCSAAEHHDHGLQDCLHHAPLNSEWSNNVSRLLWPSEESARTLWKQPEKRSLSKPHSSTSASNPQTELHIHKTRNVASCFKRQYRVNTHAHTTI